MPIELIKTLKELDFWKEHKLKWVSSTSSTNDDLKTIWRDKDFCHIIEVADIQTKGKGQYGRCWTSKEVGQNLMFSFTVDVKEYKFPISMIAGISLALALTELGVKKEDLWLKWPNDIWINDKKLSGILTESTTMLVGFRSVIGIGINILPLADKSVNSISLKEYGLSVTREKVLQKFCEAWNQIFNMSETEQTKLWNEFGGQFWNRKMKIQIPNENAFIATPLYVTSDGSLFVKTMEGVERIIISASLLPL